MFSNKILWNDYTFSSHLPKCIMSSDLLEFPQVCFTTQIVLKEQMASCAVVDPVFIDQIQNITVVNEIIINNADTLLSLDF